MTSHEREGAHRIEASVDRIEGRWAVLTLEVEVERLPEGVREGDRLTLSGEGLRWQVDGDATQRASARVEALQAALTADDDGEDITL